MPRIIFGGDGGGRFDEAVFYMWVYATKLLGVQEISEGFVGWVLHSCCRLM